MNSTGQIENYASAAEEQGLTGEDRINLSEPAQIAAAQQIAARSEGVCAGLTALITALTFGIALLTPPISGPLVADPLAYPFADIASRFPRDYYWMYPAMLLALVYLAWMVSQYHAAPVGRKLTAHLALSFAAPAAVILLVNYFVQLGVVQPSILNAEGDGIELLTQYNPHGLFIALEEIGYLLMSLSFAFSVALFARKTRLDAAIRGMLGGAALLSLLAYVVISAALGLAREYYLEITLISIDFLALIVSGGLVAWRQLRLSNLVE
jgi:hypothetical protein